MTSTLSVATKPLGITEIGDEHLGDRSRHGEPLPPLPSCSHEVTFYANDASFVNHFTRFIRATLNSGNVVIVIVTESSEQFLQRLRSWLGYRCQHPTRELPFVGCCDTLSMFMVNAWPDSVRVVKVVEELMDGAAKWAKGKHCHVAAHGELAPTLWAPGKAEAAIQLEHVWDEIAKRCDVATLCGYVLKSFHREQRATSTRRSVSHSAVYFQ